MKAIIMAGGEGTRLRPLTGGIPKPMAKLCNRPTVEYILDLLAKNGFDEAVFTLRYKGEVIESYFRSHEYKGIKLRFSYENEPLGTAGCVKNAAAFLPDDFLVISGDALCDFDLAEAMAFHKKNQSLATIITKQVTDPREYGLVIAEEGKITGFSEKPSYLGCISDAANTGIYFLSRQVLELIPDNQQFDFAKDVFPEMLRRKMPLYAFEGEGYWCDIGDLTTYRECQADMLGGLVDCDIDGRRVSEGFYTESPIPQSATIIPPCYIGRNVSIGENSILENCIIGDHASLGKNNRIFGSVILDGVFISNDGFITNSIICQNARIGHHVQIGEECVVGENSVIGEKSEIAPGVRIWQNKQVGAHSQIFRDIKQSAGSRLEIDEQGVSGITNVDITPDFAAQTGSALASLSGKAVLVSSEKSNSGKALKNALVSGISSAGKGAIDCGYAPLPVLIFMSKITDADIIVYISAKTNACITILNKGGMNLTRHQERILEAGMHRSEYKTSSWQEFGEIRTIKGSEQLYLNSLKELSSFRSRYSIFVNCKNQRILSYAQGVFAPISNAAGESLVVTLNEDGNESQLSLSIGDRIIRVSHEKLLMLAAVERFKKHEDIALPADFPVAADFLANSYEQKVYRFFACSNDDTDKKAREMAERQGFLKDGLHLALHVLHWLSEDNITLEDAVASLPDFSRENRMIKINCPPQRILAGLCEKNSGIGEGIMLSKDNGKVLLRSNKRGNSLFLFAESASAETAMSLCDEVEKLIRELDII